MKKLLAILLFSLYSYAFSIDPNLMYGLGAVKNVPAEDNPVIGLSFLKFGLITSWIESSQTDSVVRLTRLLFQSDGESVGAVKIAYLTPETIGHIVKIIDDHKDNLDQVQQAMADYLKTLPEFKDVLDLPEDVTALLDLMVDSLQYVDTTTVYPKGSITALLLGYLCATAESREDMQSYFQGFLNDSDFVLPSVQESRKSVKTSESGEKKVYKNYFCSMQNSKELENFISSFANKSKPYDALQHLVLLFFNFKDGNLIPNRMPSSLINYIDVAHLGTMMRMIEQYNDPKELVKQLQDYLIGLKIKNRVTGEFLDEESFRPLLLDLSESLQLTQGKNVKYSHAFFENILHGCVCSRLNSIKDIEDYCKGFFVHATDDLINTKKKEFACCLSIKPSGDVDPDKDEKKEPWELEFEQEDEHGHKESKDTIDGDNFEDVADAIVERTVLFDLQNEQSENSLEAIIFELVKMKNWQEKIKDDNQGSSSQAAPVLPFSVGGFYTMEKKAERQKLLEQEFNSFQKTVKKMENRRGILYQKMKIKKTKKSDTSGNVFSLIATDDPILPTIQASELTDEQDIDKPSIIDTMPAVSTKEASKEEQQEKSSIPKIIIDMPHASSKKTMQSKKTRSSTKATKKTRSSTKAKSKVTKGTTTEPVISEKSIRQEIKLDSSVTTVPVSGFIPTNKLFSQVLRTLDLVSTTGSTVKRLAISENNVLVPALSEVTCMSSQPTIGNLSLGLQDVLGLKVIPEQNIHLMIDSQVAASYFNQICRNFKWNFDVSQFDPRKEFTVKIGETEVKINLNIQKEIPFSGSKELLLPVAEMTIGSNRIVPLEFSKLPTVTQDQLKTIENEAIPDTVAVSLSASRLIDPRELTFKGNILFGNMGVTGFMFRRTPTVKKPAPQGYEKVMSKLDEIMNNEEFNKNFQVGNALKNFFSDSDDEYRKDVTEQDIDEYFAKALPGNIISVLNGFDQPYQRSEMLNALSEKSLDSLFARMPVENLLGLFDAMNPQQKLDILKKIPQASLKTFINDLSVQEFFELFNTMSKDQMQKLNISDTQNLYNIYFEKFMSLYQRQQLGEDSKKYLTIHELQGMNIKQLEELVAQRQQAYEQWQAKTVEHHEVQPHQIGMSAQDKLPHTRIPMIPPILGYRRYLQQGSLRHYLADFSSKAVRDTARSAVHAIPLF